LIFHFAASSPFDDAALASNKGETPMLITDEKWNEIIAATKAAIDRWNASAAEKGRPDRFFVDTGKTDRFAMLSTKHDFGDGYSGAPEMKLVVREIATGEMRSAKFRRKRGTVKGFVVTTPDPKAWKSLADKSGEEIERKLKLTDFIMILDFQALEPIRVSMT
jgi:hypothetical protein